MGYGPNSLPADEYFVSAEGLINQTIETAVSTTSSPTVIADQIRQQAEVMLMGEELAVAESYAGQMETAAAGMVVEKTEAGIGGYHDGSKEVLSTQAMVVTGSINDAIAEITYTNEHESYHDDGNHTAAMQSGYSADGNSVVTIGGEQFDQTALIEGLTVLDTNGQQFVSAQYNQYASRLQAAVAGAEVSMDEVRTAVNESKDLNEVDDVGRQIIQFRKKLDVGSIPDDDLAALAKAA